MEYYDSTHHETVEILACDLCFEPEWYIPFKMYPKLKAHLCTEIGVWKYGFYGSDVTYQDPAEALELLTIYERVQEKYQDDKLFDHIDEVLGD